MNFGINKITDKDTKSVISPKVWYGKMYVKILLSFLLVAALICQKEISGSDAFMRALQAK